MKISKIKTYQGIKFNLKATVKSSSGKKVNEGYVLFKIKGKKYKVPVKNGVAKKKIKISKVSKGKYLIVIINPRRLLINLPLKKDMPPR